MKANRGARTSSKHLRVALTSVLLAAVVLASAATGCGPGPVGGRAPDTSENDGAAIGTAQAFAEREWARETFYQSVPDGAIAYTLDVPDGWFVEVGEFGLVLTSDADGIIGGVPGSDVDVQFDLVVNGERGCPDAPDGGAAADQDVGLGEPIDAYEPDPDVPWEDNWSLSHSACRGDHEVTVYAEVCCTTARAVAEPYLSLAERVADSFQLVALPLADEAWETTMIENGRTALETPGTQAGRTQHDNWYLSHPESWTVTPSDPDGVGWEVSGPLGELSPGDEMRVRITAATDEEWSAWDGAADMRHGSILQSMRRLPDEVTADGRRQLRYLIDGRYSQQWSLTADVPDLGEDAEETRRLEQLVIHLLLRGDQSQSIAYPDGYPGRP